MDLSNYRQSFEAAYAAGELATAPPTAAELRVHRDNQPWIDALMTPQPLGTAVQAIRLTGARERVARRVYVRATGYPSPRFDACREAARGRGWTIREVACGHIAMIDDPDAVTAILLEAAG